MKLDWLTYTGSQPIVRNTRDLYQFQIGITNKAYAFYDVVGLEDGKSNYEFLYFYNTSNQTNTSLYWKDKTYLATWDMSVSGAWLNSGASTVIVVNITRGMEFVGCAKTSYLCVLMRDAAEASFTETDLRDNLLCTDIRMVKVCQPGAYPDDKLDKLMA